eukprot:359205-Chlamydomonas_euryale.AAC.5
MYTADKPNVTVAQHGVAPIHRSDQSHRCTPPPTRLIGFAGIDLHGVLEADQARALTGYAAALCVEPAVQVASRTWRPLRGSAACSGSGRGLSRSASSPECLSGRLQLTSQPATRRRAPSATRS